MANVCVVGALVHYPSGAASVDVTAPAWLLDDVTLLDCVESSQPQTVMLNGEAVEGVRVWLLPSVDPVEAVRMIERALDLGAAWDDLVGDLLPFGVEG